MNSNENVMPGISGQNQNNLENPAQYEISGKTFIVQPIFKSTSTESIGTLLIKLIKSDCEK